MVIKKKLSKMFYFFVFLAVILILTGGVSPIASQNPDEDALKIIRTQGTAGMQLQGGKTIVVKDNKLFVQSGKEIRSLFPENPYLTINTNDSKLTNNDMQRLALEGMKSQFADLYNQSYKIHSSYELKGEQGNEKTVVCHFVFEHKNIWYAEERTLELDILSMGNTHTLKMARI
ncbi:MAG TPA: hypothetical protein VK469_21020, partial [Candidatus Kapabacteria bacterium]|nr:hypothetical protein [Candidatus Kapabacteria bacterium]